MRQSYTLQQDADNTWSVVAEATGVPVRLAGIPQTGLERVDAAALLDRISGVAASRDKAPASVQGPRPTAHARAA